MPKSPGTLLSGRKTSDPRGSQRLGKVLNLFLVVSCVEKIRSMSVFSPSSLLLIWLVN